MQWAGGEWRGFTLLPGKPFSGDKIEGHIDNAKWLPDAVLLPRPKSMQFRIVLAIESSELIMLSFS